MFKLLANKSFLPLFITQFFGAFNDNLLKNALLILITYKLAKIGDSQFIITFAAAIFILPFFLFSASAGELADKFCKAKLARLVKIFELILMILASFGLIWQNISFLLFILFLMGTQSAFFGPIKYAILPEQLENKQLIGANSLVESGTFIAILLGTIAGGVLVAQDNFITLISTSLLICSIIGLLSSYSIIKYPATTPKLKISKNPFSASYQIIKQATQNTNIFRSILGISWFWLVGATFLTQFPIYTLYILGADETLVTLFLTLFSLGIGLGSILCGRILKENISAIYVPLAISLMSVFIIDLYYISQNFNPNIQNILNLSEFLQQKYAWRIIFDLTSMSICAGLYIVPLYTILQYESKSEEVSRIIAANNIINAGFMVVSAILTAIMYFYNFNVLEIFLSLALLNFIVAIYVAKLLPGYLIKSILRTILRLFYEVKIQGLQNYYKSKDEPSIIIANHTSFLDALLLSTLLPDRLTFAVNTNIAQLWWMKIVLKFSDFCTIDPTNPMSTKTLIEIVKSGRKIVIFPEGRITITGALMKIYEGPGMIAHRSNATIIPIRIDGPQYSPFSRFKNKVKTHYFPKIRLSILEPQKLNISDELSPRQRRHEASQIMYDLMTKMIYQSSHYHEQTLFKSLLEAQDIHGKKHKIIEDITRKKLNYKQLIKRCFILAAIIKQTSTKSEKNIGLLLPNSNMGIISFFALQLIGKVPAMLNFSSGSTNLVLACSTAQIQTIYTSRTFIENANLGEEIEVLQNRNINIIYLEDQATKLKTSAKLTSLLKARFAGIYHYFYGPKSAANPAAILFTSGSEGAPKGVILSHQNFQANRVQMSSCVDFSPNDIAFNALPIFHSFGLSAGTILPILSGIKTFFYPSPLHYRIIPELVYDTNASIMFGTDTFLANYAKYAHPYDFYSTRYIFCGAEKLKESTRDIFNERFGIRIFEGYGTTETSPLIATNTPMHCKIGSVGRIMPGIEYKLEQIEGIENGGKLLVKGSNIMKGYLLHENPASIQAPQNGWYDTGDIVEIDQEGYIFIKGRAKRFAKIAGEMISLSATEIYLNKLWPNHQHAVISASDEKKGEKLILFTTNKEAKLEEIIQYVQENKLMELSIPKIIKFIDEIPLLGTGKVDYKSLKF